jgi:simple sugar transport system ATP-binding protein
MEPALELRGIDKRFGSVRANRAVSLSVGSGTVHGLIGENGAGKSTLMNIVYGYHRADAGEIFVHGKPVEIRNPQDAIAAGIGMVHQHFMLIDEFTVLENVVLGAEGGAMLAPGLRRAREELGRLAADYGIEAPLDEPVGGLPVGLQQRVEILKALYRGADILILDEPTAVLTPREADQLFRMLSKLRAQGKTAILVTHKLREIMAISDRVTVMRQGAVVAETETSRTSPQELAEKMVGRPVLLNVQRTPARPGKPLLEVTDLEVLDRAGAARVKNAGFSVRAGEIVGVAGVAGNGQSELLDAISGTVRPSRGKIAVCGREVVAADGAGERRRQGLAHVPEDRLNRGVVASFSAEDNAVLGYHGKRQFGSRLFLSRAAIRSDCEKKMAEWDVRPREPRLRITAFSGGNQQKLVLAREIDSHPSVLIVGQPTRGVDIGAIEFIHRRLVALRDSGVAILLVSVELDEILGLSDRIIVMAGGSIVGELSGPEANERAVGLMMAGIGKGAPGRPAPDS